jgi:hypothetical protein
MEQKRRSGWTFAPVRDNAAKHHPCLRPYHQLSEPDKEKDREAVRRYPELVRAAEFGIVEIG